MEKPDCFAYINRNGHKSCYCLDNLYCKEEKCKFYKSNKEVKISIIEQDIREYMNRRK